MSAQPLAVAVLAALPEEAARLRARFTDTRRLPLAAGSAVLGRLADRPAALVVTGDGAGQARAGIEALLGRMAVARLLFIGVAGALTADLGLAALVVAAEVRAGATAFVADPASVQDAVRRCGARPATLVTADRIADSPEARARLLHDHGAPASATVDLESAIWVHAAEDRRIPWLALRAVSDTADEVLPALLDRARLASGAISRGRVLRGLLLDPAVMPALLSLRRRVDGAALVLAEATERLLGAEPPRTSPA